MALGIRHITSLEDLALALEAAVVQPVLIYKHSSTCGTSAMAFEEIEDLTATELPVEVYLVHVQGARDVSGAIETQLGVRHESPQILLVSADAQRQPHVMWHGSHFKVTAASIRAALDTHLPITTPAG